MGPRHFVCSDVHLGMPGSESRFFYESFIPQIRRDDTLILLGDILDYWISAKEIQFETVIDNWKDLHDCLAKLRHAGITIKYVPGNHDSFVFYTECADVADFYWSTWLFDNCETFRRLRDATVDFRFSRVCDIAYPFFRAEINSRRMLLTHGHWIEFAWRVLAGDVGQVVDGRRLAKFWAVAKAINTCLVHKYAPQIRRFYTTQLDHEDAFELTRRAEDIAYCILAERLLDGPAAKTGADTGPIPTAADGEMAGLGRAMDAAFKEELRGMDTRDRRKCKDRGREFLEAWMLDQPPAAQMEDVRRILENQDNAYNYTLSYANGTTRVEYQLLSELTDFEVLVFGHFHKPRAGRVAVDDGCMLTNPRNRLVQSFVTIDSSGVIEASWDARARKS